MDHTLISDVPGAIRKLKTSVKAQLDLEHETPVDGDATGSEHSNGSAVCYVGTDDPTTRPGGAALGNNNIDKGRLYLNDDTTPATLERWDGSALETIVPDDDAFGAWASKSVDTEYQAASDGFIMVSSTSADQRPDYEVLTDSSTPPTTTRARCRNTDGSATQSVCVPVKKDDYWKVNDINTFGNITIYWLPIGA